MRKRSEVHQSKQVSPEVEEISGQLAEEIRTNQETPPGGFKKFPKVQRDLKDPNVRPDLEHIVETVWVEEMDKIWNRAKRALKLGEKRSQHGHVMEALDEITEIAYDAHRLYVTAQLEHKRWMNATEIEFGAIWQEATRALQHEKDQGLRSKQITDADVRTKCATLYPDAWVANEHKREKQKLTIENLEHLVKLITARVEVLRSMLAKLRG